MKKLALILSVLWVFSSFSAAQDDAKHSIGHTHPSAEEWARWWTVTVNKAAGNFRGIVYEVTQTLAPGTDNRIIDFIVDGVSGLIVRPNFDIQFEGTDDAFETIVTVTDPTADNTVTIPDRGGTVQLLANIFDIRDYGGSESASDNQTAIESAITAQTAVGVDAWVYIPPGTWDCDDTLDIPSNARIYGDGSSSILNFTWADSAADPDKYVYINGGAGPLSNILLKDFYIKGAYVGGAGAATNLVAGIRVIDTTEIEVTGVEISNCRGFAVNASGIQNAIWHGMRVHDTGRDGITHSGRADNDLPLKNIQVLDSKFWATGDDAIAIYSQGSTGTIGDLITGFSYTEGSATGTATGMSNASHQDKDIWIVGAGPGGGPLYAVVTDVTGTTITLDRPAYATGSGNAAAGYEPAEDIVISGNEIYGEVSDGGARGIVVGGGKNVTVTGNSVQYTEQNCLCVLGSQRTSFDFVFTKNLIAQGNTFRSAGQAQASGQNDEGIRVDGAMDCLFDNVVTNSLGEGINAFDAINCEFRGLITDSGQEGMRLDGTNSTYAAYGNIISIHSHRNNSTGLTLQQPDRTRVIGSTFVDNGINTSETDGDRSGIRISSSTAATTTYLDGVVAYSSQATTKSQRYGILAGHANITLYERNCSWSGNGIAEPTFTGSTVYSVNGVNQHYATGDPAVTDDRDFGFQEGSVWINTTANTAWICVDNANGAADWNQIDGAGGGGLNDVVDDLTPQLGGDLDVNGQEINSVTGTDIDLHSDNNILMELGDAAGADKISILDNGAVEVASINSDGAAVFGHTDPGTARLLSRGSTADSSAYGLIIEDSTGTDLFSVRNDGDTVLGTVTTGVWSGTALLDAAVADTITIDQGQVVDIVGTDTIGADPAWQANAVGIGTTGIIFESAAADANEGLLVPAAIGGDRTWTLPNASGNILLTSNAATITNKTIDGDDNTIQDIGIFDHLYIPAGAFMTRTTAGATAVPNDEQWTTNDLNVDAYDFATAPPAQEGIQAQLKLPIGWDAGNLQAKVDYSHDGTAGTGVVRWNIALRAVNSDGSEAIDAAFGTAAEWNHTYDATPAGAMQTTAASGNFSDTSSDGDFLWIQIERDTDDAADTYTQAARFLGVHIQFERTLQTVSW